MFCGGMATEACGLEALSSWALCELRCMKQAKMNEGIRERTHRDRDFVLAQHEASQGTRRFPKIGGVHAVYERPSGRKLCTWMCGRHDTIHCYRNS